MKRKKIGVLLLLFTILGISVTKTYALGPTFSFYPDGGIVESKEEGFIVDVLVDSGVEQVSKARMTITFDPEVVRLRKAMRNEILFEEWPKDESTTDNAEGVIMLTGYTSSTGTLGSYSTSTQPDVFARLEFDIVDSSAEDITFDFEYNGSDELFQTVIVSETSNVLLSKPLSVTFALSEESIPETAIGLNAIGIIIGVILILAGAFVRRSFGFIHSQKGGRTIVLEK